MLATSPSSSPSTFKCSASRNGQSITMVSSYQPSPRFSGIVNSHKSPKSAPSTAPCPPTATPPLRTYRNASTQYSPMSNHAPPSKVNVAATLESGDNDGVEAIKTESNITTYRDPPLAHSSSSTSAPHASAQQTQAQSPNAKRRQFKELVDLVSPKSDASAPKRPRASKPAAKVLPIKYELCDIEDVVILIADMISELIETNDNLPLRDVVLTRFHSRTPPGISVIDYLQRLAKHAALSPPLLLSMVYYIDRLCSLYPSFTINTLTIHRFLITAATVAAKGLSDSFWNNSTYARVGGIKLAELGLLELEFLQRVDWRIVPQPETLFDYYRGLIGRSDLYVLEGDAESVEDSLDTPPPISEKDAQNDVTDTRWDKWMKDVAEDSVKKEAADDAP